MSISSGIEVPVR